MSSAGECEPRAWDKTPIWSTFVRVYRRTVTTVADRKTNIILDVKDLSPPEVQEITAEEFKIAFNSMLCPLTNSVGSQGCQAGSSEWHLTQWIVSVLSIDTAAPFISDPLDYLRNLFMTPLYLYNIMIDGIGLNPVPSIAEIPSGVPGENLIKGSLARPVRHLVVRQWTVVTYTSVGGFLVFLILGLLVSTVGRQAQKTSDFPVLDFSTLSIMSQDSKGQPEISTTFKELFRGCKAGDSDKLLERASKARVYSMPRPQI